MRFVITLAFNVENLIEIGRIVFMKKKYIKKSIIIYDLITRVLSRSPQPSPGTFWAGRALAPLNTP